ncbi:uncharacterized protein MONBRDRAFT_16518 [Monosiga brevicollis MX1]|uniref:Pyridine nucleotide-disulfide oxidoreductase domain-containing protein 2 n=1 Tax=Monosiga brevicollis TaxID=81824 RepID=A9UWP6_MONBE|nr:uncharacterized protein MONBRDRAFT_16518 [Monosiga brevicollis MX1]EDQ90250.1 predicted protein [Monosiga brevicollis MX1]|eukprot:XP_001745017.1 hypothetical protein [Monosiga brevicollis MX1]
MRGSGLQLLRKATLTVANTRRRASSATGSDKYDAVIVGGGHNGLTCAAYLAQKGVRVLVLERNDWIGGAAVTGEIVPGFKFSRASYLAGLLRPQIIKDLDLHRHGLEYLPRDPSSFTPGEPGGPYEGQGLFFWQDAAKTRASIEQFSRTDADALEEYEDVLAGLRDVVQPLLDHPPLANETVRNKDLSGYHHCRACVRALQRKELIPLYYELLTAPAAHILGRYFESDILKTTLATDAVIGSLAAPSEPGSGYVLLHHVMGEAAGRQGVWAYVRGGMGQVSQAIASAAREAGAEIQTGALVDQILTDGSGNVHGVRAVINGEPTVIHADMVAANCNPHHLVTNLLSDCPLPKDFVRHVERADYSCGAFKINCAVSELPQFIGFEGGAEPQAHHRGTIHFENHMQQIEDAAAEAKRGEAASRPVIEMTIPSAVDNTLAPEGQHVVQLFVQYAPYEAGQASGRGWHDPAFKKAFVDRVFGVIDRFAPNFSKSVIGMDALSPVDLEEQFHLHRGNIFHGALGLHQLSFMRPAPGYSSYRMPPKGLYLCGSGASPGGGVMGAPGRNAARIMLSDR